MREGQTLVYRAAYLDYVCVDPSTAKRWVELGLAEIAQEAVESDTVETMEPPEPLEESEFPGAPPPAPKPTVRDTSDDSECREDNILVYRFAYQDTICTSYSTASTWERLGISEIVDTKKSQDIVLEIGNDDVLKIIDSVDAEQVLPVEEDEQVLSVEDNLIEDDFPKIQKIGQNIWAFVDYDKTTSVFIEGETGIIVVDSLNSYTSNKKAITEFKEISDKKIKSIILTSVNSEIISASTAFVREGDRTVEIILSDALMDSFTTEFGSSIKDAITYDSQFSLSVADVEIDLFSEEGFGSFQTYISLTRNQALLVGDSNYGVIPFLLDLEFLDYLSED